MIRIKVIEVKEVTSGDGKKFTAYKTVGKGGRKMDLRFVRGCTNIPTAPCTILVEPENANVDTTRQYPIVWVKDIVRTEEFKRESNIAEYFDEN